MTIIRSSHEVRIPAPEAIENTQAWLTSMSDSAWLLLTDFRNWPGWIPGIHGVEPRDSDSPARGTVLAIDSGHATARCSLDRWDPPRSLNFSIELGQSELAFGFLIETDVKTAELRIFLELERSLIGLTRLAAFYFEWRLKRIGQQTLANFVARAKPLGSN
jgi:Polyketide cyclase / dehydrase and lipid transport